MGAAVQSPAAKAPSLSRRAEFVLKVVMVLAGPVLILASLEGFAYLWERGQANGVYAWEMVASRRMDWEPHPEPGAGYTLMKPGSHYEWQGIDVDINSHGLRGPETSVAKPPDTVRILSLGDSVAMGWGVREEDTYGRRLETWANAQAPSGLDVEVINAGVPGWNLDNAAAFLQAEGLAYAPDVVVLDVTLVNDVKGQSALLADDRPAVIKWLRSHTYFWPFLTIQARWLQARAQGRDRIDVIDAPTNPESYFPLQPEAAEWNKMWSSISSIVDLAHENDAQVVVALFPLEFQVLDADYPTTPQVVLSAMAADAGIAVVDLLPAFRRACQEEPGGPCQLGDRYMFADVWMHPSALGHQVAASELQPVLSGLLPF
jgi:lysophospholipase L1-like esterase